MWIAGGAGCDQVFTNGEEIKIASIANGFEVRVSLGDRGPSMQVHVTVVNNSPDRVNVLPERFALFVLDGNAEKPLSYRSPEQVASSLRSGVAGYAAVLNVVSSFGTPDSPSTIEEKKKAHAKVARASTQTEETIAKINEDALRSNTVFPGQTIAGVVRFERPRNRRLTSFTLHVPIGSGTISFPFTVKRQ
jgi:hypothetical protein